MDLDDLMKRNREFAACTQLTTMLISADVEYSSLTDAIIGELHLMDKIDTMSEIPPACLEALKILTHRSRLLYELIETIKTKYNRLEDGPEKSNQIKQLESELSVGIQAIREA